MTEETPSGPSRAGSVVLDVGGDVGAAIVYAPPTLEGVEVEIRAEGEPWTGRHKAIRARHVAGDTLFAAVFDALLQGRHHVRFLGEAHGGVELPIDVTGGRVAQARMPVWRRTSCGEGSGTPGSVGWAP